MVRNDRPRQVIDEVFEEVGLALGGLVVLHDVEDDFVRGLVQCMDAIRAKTLRRIEDQAALGDRGGFTVGQARLHPAVERFLSRLRAGSGAGTKPSSDRGRMKP